MQGKIRRVDLQKLMKTKKKKKKKRNGCEKVKQDAETETNDRRWTSRFREYYVGHKAYGTSLSGF